MIRARIKQTHRYGWRADIMNGGELVLTSYHNEHWVAIEWACEKIRWFSLYDVGGSHHEVP